MLVPDECTHDKWEWMGGNYYCFSCGAVMFDEWSE